jgi:hypothetical protein
VLVALAPLSEASTTIVKSLPREFDHAPDVMVVC